MTKQIPLTGKHGNGKFALVDDADYEELSQYKWYVSKEGYVVRYTGSWRAGGTTIAMHRQIMNAPDDILVDHIDRDKLHNARTNMRFATYRESALNIGPVKNSSSRYKGVAWSKHKQRWLSTIRVNGKPTTVGHFVTQREAALAYNEMAKLHFGEFAYLNNVPDDDPLDQPVAQRRPPPKSIYRGVSRNPGGKPWTVHIRIDGKTIHVGRFSDEIEAAKTYDALARTYYGDRAKLNFP